MGGLHICEVEVRGADARGAYVVIANDGAQPVVLTSMELANYNSARQHVCVYLFPRVADGSPLELRPGQCAYVFSGEGESEPCEAGWLLFAGWTEPIWDKNGDVAYLRDVDGHVVDSRVVGQSRRHPHGHSANAADAPVAAREVFDQAAHASDG
jgi:Lamin Tail Domain